MADKCCSRRDGVHDAHCETNDEYAHYRCVKCGKGAPQFSISEGVCSGCRTWDAATDENGYIRLTPDGLLPATLARPILTCTACGCQMFAGSPDWLLHCPLCTPYDLADVDLVRRVLGDAAAEVAQAHWDARPIVLPDYPENDGTDFAHPAWWRGHEHTVSVLCQKIHAILDTGDDLPGSTAGKPQDWVSVRERLLALRVSREDGS